MKSMLIDTTVVHAKGMVPLRRVVEEAEALPPEQQEVIGEELCAAQRAEYPRFEKRNQRQLDQARVDGDLHIGLIHVALSTGALTAYALRPTTDSTYRLSTALWHAVASLHDIKRSIEKGIFAVNRTLFEEQSPEWEVANRPLLVKEREATRFLRPRPASEAQLRRVSQEIVEEFVRQNPGEDKKIKREDFRAMLMKRLPASSKASTLRAWKDYTPASWKRPGPPSGPRRG